MTTDEAATAIARFGNIDADSTIKNLSLIRIAHFDLGNNFATTRYEILLNGLASAGTGHLVGLTEPQILAVATAMSSVGIQARNEGSWHFPNSYAKINTQSAFWRVKENRKASGLRKVSGMSAKTSLMRWKTGASNRIISLFRWIEKVKESRVGMWLKL